MTTTARSSGHSHPIDECRSIIRTIGTITSPNQVIILASSCPRQLSRAFFLSTKTEGRNHPGAEEGAMAKNLINEEEITVAQPWRGAMKRQVHNIIVSTLEASETMLEELDPDSDPEEQYIELMAIALNAVAAMGGVSKENFMEMAKSAAQERLDGEEADDA
jgi:hypothetical protein